MKKASEDKCEESEGEGRERVSCNDSIPHGYSVLSRERVRRKRPDYVGKGTCQRSVRAAEHTPICAAEAAGGCAAAAANKEQPDSA